MNYNFSLSLLHVSPSIHEQVVYINEWFVKKTYNEDFSLRKGLVHGSTSIRLNTPSIKILEVLGDLPLLAIPSVLL
jgi:hypothetical protein